MPPTPAPGPPADRPDREPWVGLLGVGFGPDCDLFDADVGGAYVYLVALAEDEADYRRIALDLAGRAGFSVEDLTDVTPWSSFLADAEDPDPYLLERAAATAADGEARFGEFHTYPKPH